MRSTLAVVALLTALTASVAVAQIQKSRVTFESLSASGVSGAGTLRSMPDGDTQIHATLDGLQPNTQYIALVFDGSQSCQSAQSIQVIQFESNPAGKAAWTAKVAAPLAQIESVGLRVQPTNALVACGAVTQ